MNNKDELDNLLKVIDDLFSNYRAQIYEKSIDFHRDVTATNIETGFRLVRPQTIGPIHITLDDDLFGR